jgi:uncharacterized protein YyaL (SSP411 family)
MISGVAAATETRAIAQAVLRLDAWLDSMRGPDGYGGPVAHWWQNCLQFTGAGIDWRYEGIITGYLNLYTTTQNRHWLEKACRAGDDIVRAQQPDGTYRNSCFELNPYPGGTPHEAACDLALLRLAEVLQQMHDLRWQTYLAVAARNLQQRYIAQMWDHSLQLFCDMPGVPSFVPNKAATLAESLMLLARLTYDEQLVQRYVLPTLDAVLRHQVRGGILDGAIYQNSFGQRPVVKFFPYYIARCVPGLLAGYEWSNDARYLDAAQRAMACVLRWRYDDGSFPQAVYPGGHVNRYPQWIAAVGDIIRVMRLLNTYGDNIDVQPTLDWLMRGQLSTGGFCTAHGFASQVTQRQPGSLPEFRDLLPVCGWSDKAFCCLTELVPDIPISSSELRDQQPGCEVPCRFRGHHLRYVEKDGILALHTQHDVIYRWSKGAAWAERCASGLFLK